MKLNQEAQLAAAWKDFANQRERAKEEKKRQADLSMFADIIDFLECELTALEHTGNGRASR